MTYSNGEWREFAFTAMGGMAGGLIALCLDSTVALEHNQSIDTFVDFAKTDIPLLAAVGAGVGYIVDAAREFYSLVR